MRDTNVLFEFLLRLGDNTLILGHRTSEWCGVAPALEEDIALANIALDLIGQAKLWLEYAAKTEAEGRTEDDLAYLRESYEFRNLLLVELPNNDFGCTLMRQYFFDVYQSFFLEGLTRSSDQNVRNISQRALKEVTYHLERSRDTVIALGDGTAESNKRMQKALDYLWPYALEIFCNDEIDREINTMGISPLPSSLEKAWVDKLVKTSKLACLKLPASKFSHSGGKNGKRHTEHLGHMLATMQVLQRSYPGAKW